MVTILLLLKGGIPSVCRTGVLGPHSTCRYLSAAPPPVSAPNRDASVEGSDAANQTAPGYAARQEALQHRVAMVDLHLACIFSAARNGHVLPFSIEPLPTHPGASLPNGCPIPCSTSIRFQDLGQSIPGHTPGDQRRPSSYGPPTTQCTPCTMRYSTGPWPARPLCCASCNTSGISSARRAPFRSVRYAPF